MDGVSKASVRKAGEERMEGVDGVSKAGEERMEGVDGVSEDGRRRRRERG